MQVPNHLPLDGFFLKKEVSVKLISKYSEYVSFTNSYKSSRNITGTVDLINSTPVTGLDAHESCKPSQ